MNQFIIADLNYFSVFLGGKGFLPKIERRVFRFDTCGQGCDFNMIRGICMELSDFVKHMLFMYDQIKDKKGCEHLKKEWDRLNKLYAFYDYSEIEEGEEDFDIGAFGMAAFDNSGEREEFLITKFYFDLVSKYYHIQFSQWAEKIGLSIICETHIFNEKIKRKGRRSYEKPKLMVFLGLVKTFGGNDYVIPNEMIRFWQSDLSLLSEIFKSKIQNWAINFECYCCR